MHNMTDSPMESVVYCEILYSLFGLHRDTVWNYPSLATSLVHGICMDPTCLSPANPTKEKKNIGQSHRETADRPCAAASIDSRDGNTPNKKKSNGRTAEATQVSTCLLIPCTWLLTAASVLKEGRGLEGVDGTELLRPAFEDI